MLDLTYLHTSVGILQFLNFMPRELAPTNIPPNYSTRLVTILILILLKTSINVVCVSLSGSFSSGSK